MICKIKRISDGYKKFKKKLNYLKNILCMKNTCWKFQVPTIKFISVCILGYNPLPNDRI